MNKPHLPMHDHEYKWVGDKRYIVSTMRQIVTHTIGMDNRGTYKRNGKTYYKPYRNYFNTRLGESPWPELEAAGYAAHGEMYEAGTDKQPMTDYYMTRKGLDWMGEELGIIIHDVR